MKALLARMEGKDILNTQKTAPPQTSNSTKDKTLLNIRNLVALARLGHVHTRWSKDRKGKFMILEIATPETEVVFWNF